MLFLMFFVRVCFRGLDGRLGCGVGINWVNLVVNIVAFGEVCCGSVTRTDVFLK